MMNAMLTGLLHPLHGADHLVAMIAVGIWAVQFNGRRGWLMPAAFATALPLGAVFGLGGAGVLGLSAGALELAVAASTIAVAASCLRRPDPSRSLLLVALAGLLHGMAHGSESGADTAMQALPFIVGMMASTLMLHLTGASIGRLLQAHWLSWRLAPSFVGGSLLLPQPAIAKSRGVNEELGAIEVRGNYDNAVGTSDAASAGRVTSQVLSTRPHLRPAEILEYVPGLIVTQHSGDDKANQYFLRGFNLDHGTDFATHVDGMPVNLPTHAHGHGRAQAGLKVKSPGPGAA